MVSDKRLQLPPRVDIPAAEAELQNLELPLDKLTSRIKQEEGGSAGGIFHMLSPRFFRKKDNKAKLEDSDSLREIKSAANTPRKKSFSSETPGRKKSRKKKSESKKSTQRESDDGLSEQHLLATLEAEREKTTALATVLKDLEAELNNLLVQVRVEKKLRQRLQQKLSILDEAINREVQTRIMEQKNPKT